MASIRIPTPLRPYTDNRETVQVSGRTVGEALGDLVRQYPGLEPHLFAEGRLRSFINVFVEDEDIRHLNGTETEIAQDVKMMIIPSIAGG